jgi:hypothetical protein
MNGKNRFFIRHNKIKKSSRRNEKPGLPRPGSVSGNKQVKHK